MKRNRSRNFFGAVILIFIGTLMWVPSYRAVRREFVPSDQMILDREGNPLQQQRTNFKERSLQWVPLADVPSAVKKAVIFAEDRRFFHHFGIDFVAIGSIGRSWFISALPTSDMRQRGGSTVTMQLVKILRLIPDQQRGDLLLRRVGIKFLQMCVATLIEATWHKDQILEAYLNLVQWRGELRGIGAAANGLFDKAPSELDRHDASLLAALLKFPSERAERVARRACYIERGAFSVAYDTGSCVQSYLAVKNRLIGSLQLNSHINYAPHFGRYLATQTRSDPESARRTGPNAFRSTIDLSIQKRVHEILDARISEISDRNVQDGAAMVLNYRTGEVIAYIGHGGIQSMSDQVDGIQAHRQAGSTLKPFLYELAIENRILTSESMIDDSPVSLPTAGGSYRPENYDHEFHGLIPTRVALASSLNIPAVKVGQLVGVETFLERLRSLGFAVSHEANWYGPSIALGTLDVSLWELVTAYATLARHGIKLNERLFLDTQQNKSSTSNQIKPLINRLMNAPSAWITGHIISDPDNRALTFGADSPLGMSFWVAAKTGTSKDMRDNWCIGFSDRYVVGVWVGNYSGDPMWNVSGVSGAAPAWSDIMSHLHNSESNFSKEPPPPEGVVVTSMTKSVGELSKSKSSRAYFLAGTEPTDDQAFEMAPEMTRSARIIYPSSDLVIAKDPDIPDERQRIGFEIAGFHKGIDILLDGMKVPCPSGACLWRPISGPHILAIRDISGREVDSVKFIVRN